MIENAHELESITHESTQTLNEFTQNFIALSSKINAISEENKYAERSIFIESAKLDHVVFKLNGYTSVIENHKNQEFCDHKNCNFGKWYTAQSNSDFKSGEAYKFSMQKRYENMNQIIGSFKNAEKSRQELFILMNKMLKENKLKS